jgi:hypothetical protein
MYLLPPTVLSCSCGSEYEICPLASSPCLHFLSTSSPFISSGDFISWLRLRCNCRWWNRFFRWCGDVYRNRPDILLDMLLGEPSMLGIDLAVTELSFTTELVDRSFGDTEYFGYLTGVQKSHLFSFLSFFEKETVEKAQNLPKNRGAVSSGPLRVPKSRLRTFHCPRPCRNGARWTWNGHIVLLFAQDYGQTKTQNLATGLPTFFKSRCSSCAIFRM